MAWRGSGVRIPLAPQSKAGAQRTGLVVLLRIRPFLGPAVSSRNRRLLYRVGYLAELHRRATRIGFQRYIVVRFGVVSRQCLAEVVLAVHCREVWLSFATMYRREVAGLMSMSRGCRAGVNAERYSSTPKC